MLTLITRILLIIITYLLICLLGYIGFLTIQSNLVGWYLILVAIAYAFGGPFLFKAQFKNENVIRREKYDLSFWMVIPGFLVVFYASPLEYLWLPGFIPQTIWIQIVGVILISFSLLLFGWARKTLSRQYSGHVHVKVDHTLVRHGPYRLIRHPAYAAYLIMSFGIAIGYSSLVGILSILLLLLPAFIYRISVEEKILSSEFGEQYQLYTRATRRLLPGLW